MMYSKNIQIPVLIVAIILGIVGAFGVRDAMAHPYFNSSEPGCDGSNPNYLMCDDFEDGNWAFTYSQSTLASNDGWEMIPFSPGCSGSLCGTGAPLLVYDPAAPQYVYCKGSGVAGTNCAADTGPHSGIGQAYGMGVHGLSSPVNAAATGIYIRLYFKPSTNYSYQGQKFINPIQGSYGIDFGAVSFPGGELMAFPLFDVNNFNNPLCRSFSIIGRCSNGGILDQNVGPVSNVFNVMQHLGNWIFVEVFMKNSSDGVTRNGVYQLWMDDCGANGLGCTGTPTLRASYPNVIYTTSPATINALFLENWANPGPTSTTAHELIDQLVVSKAGPIGFMGASAPKAPPPAPSGLVVGP